MTTAVTVAVARLGPFHIGIDVACLGGALHAKTALQPLATRQGALAGLAATPQGLLPVVDLRRWLPIGDATVVDGAAAAILVLQCDGRRVALQVDALAGLVVLAPGSIERRHQNHDPEELFEASALVGALGRIDLLEPERLMNLAALWAKGVPAAQAQEQGATAAALAANGPLCALVQAAGMWLAIPVGCAGELLPLPALERSLPGTGPSRGLARWRGRPVAMLAPQRMLGAGAAADATPEPWAMLLTHGPLALMLPVQAFAGLVAIPATVADSGGAPWLSQCWIDAQQRQVHVLDALALLQQLPEAGLSQQDATGRTESAASASAYIVFESDRRYALALDQVQAVLHGAPALADKDVFEWRGRQLPLLDSAMVNGTPSPVVMVLGQGEGLHARVVRQLLTLVPAHTGRLYPIPGEPGQQMLTLTLAQPQVSYRVWQAPVPGGSAA
ncbi:MAG: chemotaxis protein CheW [Burkholderiaceae bacterium]|nr:chemotaxis protein CheW [Burkholderiaceae bacterium]